MILNKDFQNRYCAFFIPLAKWGCRAIGSQNWKPKKLLSLGRDAYNGCMNFRLMGVTELSYICSTELSSNEELSSIMRHWTLVYWKTELSSTNISDFFDKSSASFIDKNSVTLFELLTELLSIENWILFIYNYTFIIF